MSSTLEAARAAKEDFRGQLPASLGVSGIGIERLPDGFGLKVNLRRKPKDDAAMPLSHNGVSIRYEVVGTIRALAK